MLMRDGAEEDSLVNICRELIKELVISPPKQEQD